MSKFEPKGRNQRKTKTFWDQQNMPGLVNRILYVSDIPLWGNESVAATALHWCRLDTKKTVES